MLALAASVAAVFIALAATRVLGTLAASQIPRAFEIGLDWTAFLFLLTVAVATGVAFGIVPALQAIRSDVSGLLSAVSSRSSRGRGSAAMINGLVVAEIALALILLTGAGLLLRALLFLEGAPTGIVAERVLTLRMETLGLLPQQAAPAETESGLSAQGRYFRAIEERVGQIPGCAPRGS